MNAKFPIIFRVALLGGVFGAALASSAITVADLRQRLEKGDKITVIDVRSTEHFQKGHIAGAINIPSLLVAEKKLPPLGSVVVYDDGLGSDTARAAAAQLNQKKGIQAEVLDGGFAGWSSIRSAATTEGGGVHKEELPMITYDQLKKANRSALVLVDLRKPKKNLHSGAAPADDSAANSLTDLQKEFPGARVTKSPFDISSTSGGQKSANESGASPLLVLIDNGDGSARDTARTLKANGNIRSVILVGGEEILARNGKSGLQRSGTTISVPVNRPQ
jgi:phage shock protein E